MPIPHHLSPVIRALRSGEVAPVLEVFDGLSGESRFTRFHTAVPRLTARMLSRLSSPEKGLHEAFVASVDGRPVGIGRWIRYAGQPRCADVALEVVDSHQRCGIGRALIGAVAESAAAAGVTFLLFTVHRDTTHVRLALTRAGAVITTDEPDELWIPTRRLLDHLATPVGEVMRAG